MNLNKKVKRIKFEEIFFLTQPKSFRYDLCRINIYLRKVVYRKINNLKFWIIIKSLQNMQEIF